VCPFVCQQCEFEFYAWVHVCNVLMRLSNVCNLYVDTSSKLPFTSFNSYHQEQYVTAVDPTHPSTDRPSRCICKTSAIQLIYCVATNLTQIGVNTITMKVIQFNGCAIHSLFDFLLVCLKYSLAGWFEWVTLWTLLLLQKAMLDVWWWPNFAGEWLALLLHVVLA
jgi:hypothetical protein